MSSTALDHVRWLGGASGAGKTTVARVLEDAFGVQTYSTDAAIAAHASEPGPDTPLLERFRRMSMDERWLARGPRTMLRTFPWFAGERFDRIVEDLDEASGSPCVLAEGFRLLPRLVSPLLREPWQAVWLIPTPEFRRGVFARRPPDEQFWRRTSDPNTALNALLERDAMFADSVEREAGELGLKTIRVDGERPVTDLADEVASWLRLPATDGRHG